MARQDKGQAIVRKNSVNHIQMAISLFLLGAALLFVIAAMDALNSHKACFG